MLTGGLCISHDIDMPSTTLWIGSLSPSITENEIVSECRRYGPLERIYVCYHWLTYASTNAKLLLLLLLLIQCRMTDSLLMLLLMLQLPGEIGLHATARTLAL
jgi:hypothetical protein